MSESDEEITGCILQHNEYILVKAFPLFWIDVFYDLKFSMTILICIAMKNCGVHNLCGTTEMAVVLIQLTIIKINI